MAKAKKITQNINKDAGLLDVPIVRPERSSWETRHSNYLTSNIGDIVPVYVDEIMPGESRKITMGMLSHLTTPIAPLFNAMYTEFRCWFVPHRLSSDLLGGYKTRKSPWVKVFGEDNINWSSSVVVPLSDQKLPDVSNGFATACIDVVKKPFGGLFDALDYEDNGLADNSAKIAWYKKINFLAMASYELIYQKGYRNQNRESATSSNLYRFLFDAHNRATNYTFSYDDSFHIAQREKDYFTGSQPFTQKGDAVNVPVLGEAEVKLKSHADPVQPVNISAGDALDLSATSDIDAGKVGSVSVLDATQSNEYVGKLIADMTTSKGINIEQLRILIKTQEMLEKDMLYGNDYASFLNAHFATAPMSLILEEPLELKKVTITTQMQAVLQTSSTTGEPSILGQVGANSTTQSGDFEILPWTNFNEWGYLIICAVHKAQNSYDASMYKSKHIFKKARFDYYTPELDDLGYQPCSGLEFKYSSNGTDAVSFNEAWAEYRFKFNKVHGMFEPSRTGAFDFWTLSCSNYSDIQSLYKQSVTELDRALSFNSTLRPQFYDAYGFVEINSKPMKLHSIPGMDGVI